MILGLWEGRQAALGRVASGDSCDSVQSPDTFAKPLFASDPEWEMGHEIQVRSQADGSPAQYRCFSWVNVPEEISWLSSIPL